VEPNNNKDADSSSSEVSSRLSQPTSCVKTGPIKKKRQFDVIGDSLLRGTEGPICRSDPLLRELCCLLRAWAKDVKRKIPTLVQPSDYYPFLFFSGRQQQSDNENSESH